MSLSHAPFVLRRVLGSMRDLLWTHVLTAATMAMTLFVFGGFLLLQGNLHRLFRGWSQQLLIFAYLEEGLKPSELESVLKRVEVLPEVEGIRFVSKKEAWESFKHDLGAQSGVLDGLEASLLPSSLEVTVKKQFRRRTEVERLAKRLEAVKGVRLVEFPQEWVEKLSLFLLAVQWAKWIFGGFLFAASLLIVGSTVKLAIISRKDEIEIMQLVGASEGMIKAPFVIEGMIQGVVGASVALLLLWLLLVFLSARLPASLGIFLPQGQIFFLDLWQASTLLFLGWSLGALGTLFSLRKFLTV